MKLRPEQIQGIAALREKLRERIMRLNEEIEETELNIAALDAALTQSSFTPASQYTPQDVAPEEPQNKQSIDTAEVPPPESDSAASKPIVTRDDSPLGSVHMYPDRIVVTIHDDISIDVDTPPFRTFFLERVLGVMEKKDATEVTAGTLPASSAMSFEVDASDGRIKKITINNYRTDERAREIDSTVRWVLNRMLEHAD